MQFAIHAYDLPLQIPRYALIRGGIRGNIFVKNQRIVFDHCGRLTDGNVKFPHAQVLFLKRSSLSVIEESLCRITFPFVKHIYVHESLKAQTLFGDPRIQMYKQTLYGIPERLIVEHVLL